MRVVREKPRFKTGRPTAAPRMPASMTLRVLNMPPISVPPSIKFGGIR